MTFAVLPLALLFATGVGAVAPPDAGRFPPGQIVARVASDADPEQS